MEGLGGLEGRVRDILEGLGRLWGTSLGGPWTPTRPMTPTWTPKRDHGVQLGGLSATQEAKFDVFEEKYFDYAGPVFFHFGSCTVPPQAHFYMTNDPVILKMCETHCN